MDWFPRFGAGPGADGDGPEPTTFLDPIFELERVRRRWEVRTAQWRARALAESIFGGDVAVALTGVDTGRGLFRGLLHMDVPFDDLALHRWRERLFRACAAADPVLQEVPVVYVFRPRVLDDAAPAAPSGEGP